METNNMVSIILPVYNGEKYISDAIKSILNQTYDDFELIIVDDCSIDKTEDIIKEFEKSDDRIRVIKNRSNYKLPKSLNIGFMQAKGAYYTWTSDDNMYKSNAIETLVSYLKAHPEASMVYSNYSIIDENGDIKERVELSPSKSLLYENVCGASFMYTKSIAEEVGSYDENLFLAEDYDYWLRIFSKGNISHISDDLYLYRCHRDSLTFTRKEIVKKQAYKAMEKNFFSLYAEAKKEHSVKKFFNRLLEYGSFDYQQVLEKLIRIDTGYRIYTYLKKTKKLIYKVFHK